MLNNPALLRQMMETMRNPVGGGGGREILQHASRSRQLILTDKEYETRSHQLFLTTQSLMAEQMRQTDRQLSNIEAMPEGFNRLRQLYETIQVWTPRCVDRRVKGYDIIII